MLLGYNETSEFSNEIEINDLGNFSLHCMSPTRKLHWYYSVRTTLGTATIVSFGPLREDTVLLPNGYSFNVKRIEFNEDKLFDDVIKFLNKKSKQRNIGIVSEISYEEFVDAMRDMKYYFSNYGEEYY